jgi:hypothetical protein
VFKFIDPEDKRVIDGPALTFFDEPPDRNISAGNFVARYWDLPSGHAIAIKNAFFPQTSALGRKVLLLANAIFKRTGHGAGAGWRPNLLHAFLAEFIEQNSDLVADYYLGFPALNGITIIVKA